MCADPTQQHTLVADVRDKVLECATAATASTHLPPDVVEHKRRNVNMLLHALGLDASQLAGGGGEQTRRMWDDVAK